jgi:hypothetical protein
MTRRYCNKKPARSGGFGDPVASSRVSPTESGPRRRRLLQTNQWPLFVDPRRQQTYQLDITGPVNDLARFTRAKKINIDRECKPSLIINQPLGRRSLRFIPEAQQSALTYRCSRPLVAHPGRCESQILTVTPEAIMIEYYIENDAYSAVVNVIATIAHLAPDQIKMALGEHGNIWPRRIQSDAIRLDPQLSNKITPSRNRSQ